jgi:hypothetical protein
MTRLAMRDLSGGGWVFEYINFIFYFAFELGVVLYQKSKFVRPVRQVNDERIS